MLSTINARPHRQAPAEVRAALATGDLPRALATMIAAYGTEVSGFLRAVMPRSQDARLTYGRTIEALRNDLETFAWSTELRVLFYAVARDQARRDRAMVDVIYQRMEPEDLELLVLRLDRGFSWRQIAYTALGANACEADLLAESARSWTRFLAMRRDLSPQQT